MSEVADRNAEFLLPAQATSADARAPGADRDSASAIDLSRLSSDELTLGGASLAALLGVGRKYLLAIGLASCYVLFFGSLYLAGQIDASPLTVAVQLGLWLVVAVALFRNSHALSVAGAPAGVGASRNDVLFAIWCNVGVVAVATLLGGELRLLLMVGVVFGLLYTGLHFSEVRVRTVMLATLLAYGGCVAIKSTQTELAPEFELLCALGLAVLLFASSLISREIIRLRLQARGRNRQLAHALRRVEELALRDELTGLYNRRHLLDFLERAIAARERGGPAFALAYCDLDHFKRVNDRFGHECGDRLLQSFAKAALSSVRTNDLVARLGGEEFVLVLVDADETDARDIVERLRMRIAALTVSSAEPSYSVTLSVGLATHGEDDTVDRLLRRADGALYQAKEQGRDQLVQA